MPGTELITMTPELLRTLYLMAMSGETGYMLMLDKLSRTNIAEDMDDGDYIVGFLVEAMDFGLEKATRHFDTGHPVRLMLERLTTQKGGWWSHLVARTMKKSSTAKYRKLYEELARIMCKEQTERACRNFTKVWGIPVYADVTVKNLRNAERQAD